MSIRVVLADDQEMVRAGFRLILEATDDISVVGEAADGRTAVDLCRRLRPDVALLDIRMPVLDGLEATRLLAGREVADPVRVVVVTTFDLDEYVHAALLHGATGFLLKDAGPALLVEAVRAAVRGDALVSPQITTRLLRQLSSGAAGRRRPGRAPDRAGGRGPDTRRPRPHQRRDRREPLRLLLDGEVPPGLAAGQARRPQPG